MTELEIKKFLKTKHEQFIDTLFHAETRAIIRDKTYFAGGCIRDLNNGRIPRDYDLFFYEQDDCNKFIELSIKEVSLKKTKAGNANCKKGTAVQVITMVSEYPEKLIKTFDFTINNGFYCLRSDKLVVPKEKINLVINPEIYSPFNALLRVSKFVDMGYKISDKTLFKLGLMLTKFKNEEEAIDSLKGVSTSYLKKDGTFITTAEDLTSGDFKWSDFGPTPSFHSSDDIPF